MLRSQYPIILIMKKKIIILMIKDTFEKKRSDMKTINLIGEQRPGSGYLNVRCTLAEFREPII